MTGHRLSKRFALATLVSTALGALVLYRPPPRSFAWLGATVELGEPRAFALLACVPIVLAVAAASLDHASKLRRTLGLSTRLLLLVSMVVALAEPTLVTSSDRVFAVFLVDASDSVLDAALASASRTVRTAIAAKHKGDEVRVVAFGRTPHLLAVDSSEAEIPFRPRDRHEATAEDAIIGSATDIANAVRFAGALFPLGYVKRIALLSDGVETEGDLAGEVSESARLGVRLFASPYEGEAAAEVAVLSVELPSPVRAGETVPVHVHVFSNRDEEARITLQQGLVANSPDAERRVQIHPGDNDVVMKSRVSEKGDVAYTAEVSGLAEDRFRENNVVVKTVTVKGPPTVLYVQGANLPKESLVRALSAEQIDVESVSPADVPASLAGFAKYDFALLSDVPPDSLSAAQAKAIEEFVREGGGLLSVLGHRGAASAGGPLSLRPLLPIVPRNEATETIPGVAMSLLIDRSGSMIGTPLEMAKSAARATAAALAPDDLIEVIAFDSLPTRVVPLTRLDNREVVADGIARIAPGGGTAIRPALDAAYQSLVPSRARRKHVVLLTDGEADARGIRELTTAMAAEGITVSSIALGGEVDEALLRMIAEVGGGRFYRVPDAASLPRIFVREAEAVAKKPESLEHVRAHVRGARDLFRGVDLEAAPALHGYAKADMRPTPAELLLTAGATDPLLARWHVGLGWSLAWTSDVAAPWSADWVSWPGYARFFSNVVREHMRPRQKHELPLRISFEPRTNRVSVSVEAVSEQDEFLELSGSIHVDPKCAAPAGSRAEPEGAFDLPLRHLGPGRYGASFDGSRLGSYRVTARLRSPSFAGGGMETVGHADHSYLLEYAPQPNRRELLKRAAEATSGALAEPSQALVAGPDRAPVRDDIWSSAVLLALLFLVLDVAARRMPAVSSGPT